MDLHDLGKELIQCKRFCRQPMSVPVVIKFPSHILAQTNDGCKRFPICLISFPSKTRTHHVCIIVVRLTCCQVSGDIRSKCFAHTLGKHFLEKKDTKIHGVTSIH